MTHKCLRNMIEEQKKAITRAMNNDADAESIYEMKESLRELESELDWSLRNDEADWFQY